MASKRREQLGWTLADPTAESPRYTEHVTFPILHALGLFVAPAVCARPNRTYNKKGRS